MSVKSEYYKLSKEAFSSYLDGMKNSLDTIFMLGGKYFYAPEKSIRNALLELNKAQWQLDSLFSSFTLFGQKQIIQSFFINEIKATNIVENIHSTRHDIFSLMKEVKNLKNTKIASIVNGYKTLLDTQGMDVTELNDIKEIYFTIMDDAIEIDDLPDGEFFRKGAVFVNDGIKNIHEGAYPEAAINEQMEEFISLYNSDIDVYEKMVLCHFMIETIHPYYDGNGRLGRFLLSNKIFQETGSCFALLISNAIANEKDKYYKAFKLVRDIHEYGCINEFVLQLLNILLDRIRLEIKNLTLKKEEIQNITIPLGLTKSEAKIFKLLAESTLLSHFGVCQKEIMEETKVSKRTLISFLNALRSQGKLDENRFGRTTYHKLKKN